MTNEASEIATVVLERFDRLPSKRKPSVRSNGLHEWVPLSGIVARVPDGSVHCLALATGMKCLPSSKLPQANGVAIHDWHAEVLAMRAFNLFILQECRRLALGEQNSSQFLRRRTEVELTKSTANGCSGGKQPFTWRQGATLHMYCSEAPCGDSSMELIMAAQEDASPWDIPPAAIPDSTSPHEAEVLPGRAYFSQLGIVRRKPARGDAPPCLSKSCSDKIALKQCTSLLSSLTSLLVSPKDVYISSLVVPESQYSAGACIRCFSTEGRMNPVAGRQWEGDYAFVPFRVETTQKEFDFSKRKVSDRSQKIAASNLAAAWTWQGSDLGEGLVGGVLQGTKQFDLKGASLTSRRKMWALTNDIIGLLRCDTVPLQILSVTTYGNTKEDPLLEERRRVKQEVRKQALQGWVRNIGDEVFTLE